MANGGKRVALVHRGDRRTRDAGGLASERLTPVAVALDAVGLAAEAAVYDDSWADEVHAQLLDVQAALVWVDPIAGDQDRTRLDDILRAVSSAGVWVSAHPDTVRKMGTKDVLYDTRQLGWGSDTHRYASAAELETALPQRLVAGPRVLKQHRGNGGIGVWKVGLRDPTASPPSRDSPVLVQSARERDEKVDEVPLGAFLAELEACFAADDGNGHVIDQPFVARIVDGIVRCYLVGSEVVGFSRQRPASDAGAAVFGLPSAKTMYGADEPSLRSLRMNMELDWVPAMQRLLNVASDALPALWDADFLYGARDDKGDDTYILCEINASCVTPFPPDAAARLADYVRRVLDP